jgi:hypothetical protein
LTANAPVHAETLVLFAEIFAGRFPEPMPAL